jgi:hypothetical protein
MKTGLYYSGWHSWTGETKQAFKFERTEDAIQKVRGEKLRQMEMLIQEGDPVKEKVVP